eukprot:g333.t1
MNPEILDKYCQEGNLIAKKLLGTSNVDLEAEASALHDMNMLLQKPTTTEAEKLVSSLSSTHTSCSEIVDRVRMNLRPLLKAPDMKVVDLELTELVSRLASLSSQIIDLNLRSETARRQHHTVLENEKRRHDQSEKAWEARLQHLHSQYEASRRKISRELVKSQLHELSGVNKTALARMEWEKENVRAEKIQKEYFIAEIEKERSNLQDTFNLAQQTFSKTLEKRYEEQLLAKTQQIRIQCNIAMQEKLQDYKAAMDREIREEIASLRAPNAEIFEKNSRLTDMVESLEVANAELKNEIDSQKKDIKVLGDNYAKDIETYERTIQQMEIDYASKEKEITQLKKALEIAQQEINSMFAARKIAIVKQGDSMDAVSQRSGNVVDSMDAVSQRSGDVVDSMDVVVHRPGKGKRHETLSDLLKEIEQIKRK